MKRRWSLGVLLLGVILWVALNATRDGATQFGQTSAVGTEPDPPRPENRMLSTLEGRPLCRPAHEETNKGICGDGVGHGGAISLPLLTDPIVMNSDSEEPEAPIRSWARENPSAAATWAAQQSVPALRQEALNQVALAWAESDVTQALEWALQLPADEAQADVLKNLGYELARTDPVKALALAATLSPERGRDDLLIHAASQWANTDALAATEWACSIPGLALRERVLAAITTAVADQNPESAVLLTTQTIWPGKSQNQAAIAIVQRWTQQDPKEAASWVQQFPAGELKTTALNNLIAVGSQSDSEASGDSLVIPST